MGDWKPGTFVEGLLDGNEVSGVIVYGGRFVYWADSAGANAEEVENFTNLRPLTVCAEDEIAVKAEDVRDVVQAVVPGNLSTLDRMQAVLDAYDAARTPAIEEPMRFGAVVEDVDGVRWLSFRQSGIHGRPWTAFNVDEWRDWDDIKAVRVLSPGVEADA